MKRFAVLIPTLMLFATPWTHKLIYMNIMAADLGISSEGAHTAAAFGALFAFLASCFLYDGTRNSGSYK